MADAPPSYRYPLARPLFLPGEAEGFLYRLTDDELAGILLPDDQTAWERALSLVDLDVMVTRATVALGLWALRGPALAATLSQLSMPEGANPVHIWGCLGEIYAAGGVDRDGLQAWGHEVGVATECAGIASLQGLGSTEGAALLRCVVSVPVQPYTSVFDSIAGDDDLWVARVALMGRRLHRALDAAAMLIAEDAPGPRNPDVLEQAQREARSRVLDVFSRHAAGLPFEVPRISLEDLLLLTGHTSPAVRLLAVTMADHTIPGDSRLD